LSAAAVVDRLQGLSHYARTLLLGPHDPVAPPIRAELFGAQRFEQHGHSLARAQVVEEDRHRASEAPFFPRVDENLESLRNAFDYIARISQSGRYVSPAAEWLLDNFHLVEAQLQQIHDGVPRSYYARLPKLATPPLAGLPRVYGIAWAYVAHTDSVLNKTLFTAFLNAYQDIDELTLGELWALPTTLRVVLLENLRRVAESIAENKVAREIAHAAWDAAPHLSAQDLDVLYRALQSHGLQDNYLTQLWQRLPVEHGENMPALVRWTEQHCPNGPALINDAQNAQAAANLTVGNIITTLRMIGQVEWSDLIEPVSRSLRVLRELPSFASESERTRQQITHAMERVARDTEQPEREVAEAVVRMAASAPADDAAAETDRADGTAGYYLFGQGRPALIAALLQSDGQAGRNGRAVPIRPAHGHRSWRLPAYLLSVAVGTALLLFAVAHGLAHRGDWTTVVALVLLAWPLSEALIALAQRIMAESVRVQALPRLDFAAGIPERHRALVVIPTLLTSAASNAQLAHRLELHWLANREPHAQFALLTDWADAAQASLPEDAPLLEDAIGRVAALNAKYPASEGAAPRFLVLHRPRTWSDTEERWMGWERKRGKLEMLVRLLASGNTSNTSNTSNTGDTGDFGGFLPLAQGQQLAAGRTPYVLTLDSDTGLPPGALRDLVSIAAHPLNAPEVDAESRRVVAGFGILQPRIVTPFPMQSERSPFHWMFAGQCGLDPYGSGASDIYQDVFGSGSFTGKGLLNVRAVHATLNERLPDSAVLSHDLLEGTVARCAMVSDVVLVEDHPHHAGVAASRVHRWVRGDWQLLPLMWRARRFGIDALGLWKMGDNLRRSQVVPASFALLVLVIFTQAMPLGWALAAVGSALTLGPLLGALAGLVPTRRAIELRHFFDVGAVELLRAMAGAAWQFVQLAAQTRLLLDAAFLATWRLVVSRKHLLQWTTAAQAQAQSSQQLLPFLRGGAFSSVACLALAVAAHWSAYPIVGPLLFALWALAPVAAWWSSRVDAEVPDPLNADQRTYLEKLAHDTWLFFEHVVGPDDNHLPPDNLQLEPQPTIAHRTSPTNIGMYLLAACCAREFRWIDTAALLARIGATLDTVDRMQKHQGHLFNWYDTQTLKPLPPDYVSSVDSGNFAGHLVAVAQACRAFSAEGCESHEAPALEALEALAQRCDALHAGMDFSGLYDAKRHLFHIGLRVEENVLDASYYDLLASESRLLSFLAIAKGDVPRRHWMALGRPFLLVGFEPSLKSWSGSMFEYLMPALVMSEPEDGLLQVANTAAIAEQQAFGRAQNLPWGVSESAYFAQDHSLAYQYSPFGVPRLALRRTPPTDRVVAPYASVMAAVLAPAAAVANLERLESLGARGEFGFHDAVDFTASRQAEGQDFTVVRNFMAHHQGMSLVALCNVLCADGPRRWFGSAALVQAHESLLHERTPRQIIGSADPRTPPEPSQTELAPLFQPRLVDPMAAGFQPTHLLSNGRYTVALRANGAGVSRWRSFNVTRWRDDPLRDSHGTFFYIRDEGRRELTSLTALPAPGADWLYRTRFLADQVQFDAAGPGLQVRTTVLISPEDDTELRSISLHNSGDETRTLELISYFEPVLSNPKADEAHPAFANLFVESRWEPALARAADVAQAAAARRPGGGRGALRRLGRCARALDRLHDRPARLHRPQPLARQPRARRAAAARQRHAGERPGPDRVPARAPVDRAGRHRAPDLRDRRRRKHRGADAQHRPLPAAHARGARHAHGRHAGAGAAARPEHRARAEPGAAGPDDHPHLHHAARDEGPRAHRPPADLALRHLGRQAHRAGLHPLDERHGARQHALARAAVVGLRRRGLRPGGAQQRAQLLPDAAAARDRDPAHARAAADPEQLSAQRHGRLLPAARPRGGAIGEGRAFQPRARGVHGRRARARSAGGRAARGAQPDDCRRQQRAGAAAHAAPDALGRGPVGATCDDADGGARRPLRRGERRVPLRRRHGQPHAAPLGQRDRQCQLRLPGVRVGHGLHLGRQQPHAPGHAVVERPGAGPRLRALPAAGPGHARAAAAHARRPGRQRLRRRAPPGAARPGLHGLRMPAAQPDAQDHLLRGPRRCREAGACARAQRGREPAAPARARHGRVADGRGARRAAHRALLEAGRPAGRVRPAARIGRRFRRQHGLPAARGTAGRDAMDLRPQRILRRPRHRRGARDARAARGQRARCLRGHRRRVRRRRRRDRGPSPSCWATPTTPMQPSSLPAAGGSATCPRRSRRCAASGTNCSVALRCARPILCLRRDGQPLAASAQTLACRHLVEGRLLPGRRRLRFPRPAAGRDVAGRSSRDPARLR
jgi:hypothetical protein